MVISLTTSQVTPEHAHQVEDLPHGFFPHVREQPGVVAIYDVYRPGPGESTNLIVWETDEARHPHRESTVIEQAAAFERKLGLTNSREAYPLTYATQR